MGFTIGTDNILRSTGATIARGEAFTGDFAADATAFFRNGNTISFNGRVIDDQMWTTCMGLRSQEFRQNYLREQLGLPTFDFHDFKLMLDDLTGSVASGSVGSYSLSMATARRHGIVDGTRVVRHQGIDQIEILQRGYGRFGSLELGLAPGMPAPAAARTVRTYPSSCAPATVCPPPPPPVVCPPRPTCPAPSIVYRDPPSFSGSSSTSSHSAVEDAIVAPEL